MGTIRQMKRKKQPVNGADPRLLEVTFNRGFDDGAKAQREADIENMVKLLEDLEQIPGIGEKRAILLRQYFMKKFGSFK